ncbi:unnamed protein product [Amoebophrya sp. A120]|nr:unnamed protein product [Amoebophrya sp. A120]|eukprot:GSA120T00014524001.1
MSSATPARRNFSRVNKKIHLNFFDFAQDDEDAEVGALPDALPPAVEATRGPPSPGPPRAAGADYTKTLTTAPTMELHSGSSIEVSMEVFSSSTITTAGEVNTSSTPSANPKDSYKNKPTMLLTNNTVPPPVPRRFHISPPSSPTWSCASTFFYKDYNNIETCSERSYAVRSHCGHVDYTRSRSRDVLLDEVDSVVVRGPEAAAAAQVDERPRQPGRRGPCYDFVSEKTKFIAERRDVGGTSTGGPLHRSRTTSSCFLLENSEVSNTVVFSQEQKKDHLKNSYFPNELRANYSSTGHEGAALLDATNKDNSWPSARLSERTASSAAAQQGESVDEPRHDLEVPEVFVQDEEFIFPKILNETTRTSTSTSTEEVGVKPLLAAEEVFDVDRSSVLPRKNISTTKSLSWSVDEDPKNVNGGPRVDVVERVSTTPPDPTPRTTVSSGSSRSSSSEDHDVVERGDEFGIGEEDHHHDLHEGRESCFTFTPAPSSAAAAEPPVDDSIIEELEVDVEEQDQIDHEELPVTACTSSTSSTEPPERTSFGNLYNSSDKKNIRNYPEHVHVTSGSAVAENSCEEDKDRSEENISSLSRRPRDEVLSSAPCSSFTQNFTQQVELTDPKITTSSSPAAATTSTPEEDQHDVDPEVEPLLSSNTTSKLRTTSPRIKTSSRSAATAVLFGAVGDTSTTPGARPRRNSEEDSVDRGEDRLEELEEEDHEESSGVDHGSERENNCNDKNYISATRSPTSTAASSCTSSEDGEELLAEGGTTPEGARSTAQQDEQQKFSSRYYQNSLFYRGMSLPEVRVKPSAAYTAEVVVLITTLGTKRTEFNAGQRARDLLEIKRAHFKIIDFNRDARAQTTVVQGKAIAKLSSEQSKWRRLHTDDDDDLILPQIFIDGLYVGDADDLQGLEDDGLLDALLRREKCPCRNGKAGLCNADREEDQKNCGRCGERFQELLPGAFTFGMKVRECEEYERFVG